MTCKTPSFLPNLQPLITYFVSQCNTRALSDKEAAQIANQVITEIYTFAHIHPQPAREGFKELLKVNNLNIRCTALAGGFPLLVPTMIAYYKVRLVQGGKEETIQGISHLIGSLNSLSLTLKREALVALLPFEVEEIQIKAAENLSKLLNIETLAHDVENKQIQELIDLEKQVSKAIKGQCNESSPTNFLYQLLDIYQALLERLWLLPCLTPDQSINEKEIELVIDRVKTIHEDLKKYDTKRLQGSLGCMAQMSSMIGDPKDVLIEEGDPCQMVYGKECKTYLDIFRLPNMVGSPVFTLTLGWFYLHLALCHIRAAFYFDLCLKGPFLVEDHREADKAFLHNMLEMLYVGLKERRGEICEHLLAHYVNEGQQEKIIEIYERLKKLNMSGSAESDPCLCLHVGNAYFDKGDRSEETAAPLLRKAYESAAKASQTKLCFQASGTLGNLYGRIHQNAKAKEWFQKALTHSEGDKDKIKVLSSLTELLLSCARDDKDHSLWAEGIEYAKQWESHYKEAEHGPDDLEAVVEFARFGDILCVQAKYLQAQKVLNKVAGFAKNAGHKSLLAKAHSSLGRCWLLGPDKNFETAENHFEEALGLFVEVEDKEGELSCLNNLGLAQHKLLKLDKATKTLEKYIDLNQELSQKLNDNTTKICFFEDLSKGYLQLEEVLVYSGKTNEALEVSDFKRAQTLNGTLLKNRLPHLGISKNKKLTIEDIKKMAREENTIFIVFSLSVIDEGTQNLFVWTISSEAVNFEHRNIGRAFNVQETGSFLKEYPCQTKGMLQASPSPAAGFLELASDLVETEVKGRKYAERQKEKDQELEAKRAEFHQQLRSWYDMLIAPIKQHLPQSQDITLTILPDSDLATLPFALFQDQEGKYLIEKYPIAIAPSIQTLALLSERKGQTELPRQSTIVSMPSNPEVPPIKSSAEEAKAIQKLFETQGEVTLLSQQEATVSNVLKKAKESRFLHVDCHGKAELKFDPYSVYEGGLYLSTEEDRSPGSGNSGCLYAEQISQTPLNAELVVLSACHSGRGKLQREGIVGLPHAFLAAGALSVAATHWELPASDLTIDIIKAFYSHILGTSKKAQARRRPLNKAQALREAMLLGIEKERDKPELWGALFLTGLS